jgi:hypothetical protein
MFAPLREVGRTLNDLTGWPSVSDLKRLAGPGVVSGAGVPLRFVEAGAQARPELSYERRIFESGEVVCRSDDWHDLFNALVWLAFPRAKAALNARHVREMAREAPGKRGRARDALTLFDEGGLIVASADRGLLQLIREFRWKALFWQQRVELTRRMRFFVFGHALYEKALAPFVGITASALLLEVDDAFLAGDARTQLAVADRRVGEMLSSEQLVRTPRDFSPVPVLGVPGWSPSTADERFYENTGYFRPGRAHAPGGAR